MCDVGWPIPRHASYDIGYCMDTRVRGSKSNGDENGRKLSDNENVWIKLHEFHDDRKPSVFYGYSWYAKMYMKKDRRRKKTGSYLVPTTYLCYYWVIRVENKLRSSKIIPNSSVLYYTEQPTNKKQTVRFRSVSIKWFKCTSSRISKKSYPDSLLYGVSTVAHGTR